MQSLQRKRPFMLLLLLVFLSLPSCRAAPRPLQTNSFPVCSPNKNGTSNAGGMFGYAVDLVAAEDWMWLAVGEPWLSSVHIYRAQFDTIDDARGGANCVKKYLAEDSMLKLVKNVTSGLSAEASIKVVRSAAAVNGTVCPQLSWDFVTSLTMPPALPLSLFGYSLSWSVDAEYLAVGAPGTSPPAAEPALAARYGEVRVFKRKQVAFALHATLNSTSSQRRRPFFYDRFGSKVQFARPGSQRPLDAAPPPDRNAKNAASKPEPDVTASLHFLFIVSNGGWDGVSAPGIPIPGTNSASVYGDQIATGKWPTQNTTSTENLGVALFTAKRLGSLPPTVDAIWNFTQFIESQSPEPFGMLGIAIDAKLRENGALTLAVRDQLNENGAVSIYVWSDTEAKMTLQSSIRSLSPAGRDWFGAGLGLSFSGSGIQVLHIGAPRTAGPVRRYVAGASKSSPWVLDGDGGFHASSSLPVGVEQALIARSFFGGTIAALENTLLVADAVSPAGPGKVYLLRKRTPGLLIAEFNDVVTAAIAENNGSSAAYPYDWIATLTRPNTTINFSGSKQDQFGYSIAIQNYTIAVGAPVLGCVFVYADPISYTSIQESKEKQIKAANENQNIRDSNWRLFGYIALGVGILAALLVALAVFLYIKKARKDYFRKRRSNGR